MPPGQEPFQTALRALREQLRQGVHRPGSALSIIELARALKLSHTPVREVLSRLAGEGLVERRGNRYFVWQLGAGDLLEMYDAHAYHVRLGLEALVQRAGPSQSLLGAGRDELMAMPQPIRAEWIFDRIVTEIGNRYLLGQHRRLAERLSPMRLAEPHVLSGIDDEIGAISQAYLQGAWLVLTEELSAYHERRRRQAGVIAALFDALEEVQPRL